VVRAEFAIGNEIEGFKEFKLVMTDIAISLRYKNSNSWDWHHRTAASSKKLSRKNVSRMI
jgi:hypothetical protein